MLTHAEAVRLYGPWDPRTPADASRLLSGYRGPWWVAGGWAIEAFTGVSRPHGDLDLGVPREDVTDLRRYLAGRLDVWAADSGTLRPLLPPEPASPGRTPAPHDAQDPPPRSCGNLWLRRSGAEPWQFDMLLNEVVDGTWTYKRDARLTWSLDDALWRRDGVAYLRPEVQLLHKARGRRPQDEQDFATALPHLPHDGRRWLNDALTRTEPGHPWLADLSGATTRA